MGVVVGSIQQSQMTVNTVIAICLEVLVLYFT
jgi:hypothetical protein